MKQKEGLYRGAAPAPILAYEESAVGIMSFMNNLEILTCTVNDLNKKLEDGENCQIIDVREEHEYERVRIKNSKLLPLSLFEKDYVNVDKSKPAYMLCAIGKRATMAANYLMANGYKDVIVIDGGIKDWIDSGLEVEVGA